MDTQSVTPRRGVTLLHYVAFAISAVLVIAGVLLLNHITGCYGYDDCRNYPRSLGNKSRLRYEYRPYGYLIGSVGIALAVATLRDARR